VVGAVSFTVLNPVIDGVGNVPISPPGVLFAMLVMPPPARTTKESAVPSGTGAVAAWALAGIRREKAEGCN
jgi:hypothetical protein